MPAPEPNTDQTVVAPRTPTAPGSDAFGLVEANGPPRSMRPDGVPIVDGYEMGRQIARGGMGVVYIARDTSLDRVVAVKVMLPGMSAAEFERESKVTARLPHPGVPPVHALGSTSDGRPFLAMKLIEGLTLKELLTARPDPAADRSKLVAAFEQICQAVGYAHAQGFVHRDLKPSNVMVGAFGEVQVMDWGLAKAVSAFEDDASVSEAPLKPFSEDVLATVAGQVKGTPAYMAPEQARGEPVDCRADVFALGGILAVVLTGRPPFVGDSVFDTVVRAANAELDEMFAELDRCGADKELIELAKWCLSARAEDRPANGAAVAEAVAAYRAGVDERLRRAEQERAAAEAKAAEEHNTRREAEAREREQRKRRRVELALAGFVILVAVGGGIAATEIQKESDRREAEKRLTEERFEAETKRRNDLDAADAAAREKQRVAQRETRASALVDALATAETAAVPRLVGDLQEYRDLTGAKLRELAAQPATTKPGLHARLALIGDEPNRAAELAAYLPTCKPEELLTVRTFLKLHAEKVAPGLWAVLTNPEAGAGRRVRAACALAGLAPTDRQWATVAPAVSDLVVRENPLAAAVWLESLEPVRAELIPVLVKRYDARSRPQNEKLDAVQLAAEVSAFDLTATALAHFMVDRPADAAERMLLSDPRHAAQFVPAVAANRDVGVPILKAALEATGRRDDTDEALEALGRRRGRAAAVLTRLGETEPVWPLFVFPADGDPTARSHLLTRLADVGADPLELMRRFEVEPDVSAKRALLIALGNFPASAVPAVERAALASKALTLYREYPDPGIHGALDWLLRRKWGKAKEVAAIDADLVRAARAKVMARALADVGPLPLGPLMPAPGVAGNRNWYVNGEGQTYSVVRGPVVAALGSPPTELGRNERVEQLNRKLIPRTFAIATKEVTVEQFLRFRPKHEWDKKFSPGLDTPAVAMTWYVAATYCNWLSAREGIPRDQWCYEVVKGAAGGEGMRMKAGHLKLAGYRLPTGAEWEYACRSGTVTTRYYGRGEELLPHYGWFSKNSEEHAWPVGTLRPNELGLFDTLGNVLEWTEDPDPARVPSDDVEDSKPVIIEPGVARLNRGGAFTVPAGGVRSAHCGFLFPGARPQVVGFRPARTLN